MWPILKKRKRKEIATNNITERKETLKNAVL